MGEYNTAQVCLNGHMINSMAKTRTERNQDFCDKCGARTITKCPHCNVSIRGYYDTSGFSGLEPEIPPSFCYNCGKPYPWTETKLRAGQELVEEFDKLTGKEKDILQKSLGEIIRDTPQTAVATMRFKKLVAKAGGEAAKTLKNLLVDVVRETVKKTIWG